MVEEHEQHGTNEGKLWGGRFAGGPSPELEALSRSTHFDWRLAPYDLAGSRAHAKRCTAPGCSPTPSSPSSSAASTSWARAVRRRRPAPRRRPTRTSTAPSSGCCSSEVGADVGGRLRAGRSRNDQVATLFRLYLRDHARVVAGRVLDLVDALRRRRRDAHLGATCRAAPTSSTPSRCCSSHHLLAHALAAAARRRPAARLGRRAAADSPLRLGRAGRLVARPRPARPSPPSSASPAPAANSIDGTASATSSPSSRSSRRMIGVDLSRLAEEVVLWATTRVRLRHAATTPTRPGRASCRRRRTPTSPSSPAARPAGSIGNLAGLLATLKALPLAYNRDLQEDKEPVFDAVDTLEVLLPASRAWSRRSPSTPSGMAELAPQGFSLATDVAEWLVREGVPFRVAHEVAGACVRRCEERGIELRRPHRRASSPRSRRT